MFKCLEAEILRQQQLRTDNKKCYYSHFFTMILQVLSIKLQNNHQRCIARDNMSPWKYTIDFHGELVIDFWQKNIAFIYRSIPACQLQYQKTVTDQIDYIILRQTCYYLTPVYIFRIFGMMHQNGMNMSLLSDTIKGSLMAHLG